MRMFVGNLDFETSDEEILDAFLQYGSVVTSSIMKNGNTGESHGYALVEMAEDSEAEAAIKGLDGMAIRGRPLMVSARATR